MMKRLSFVYVMAIVLASTLLFLSGCSSIQSAKKDQLILEVPDSLMIQPKPLQKL